MSWGTHFCHFYETIDDLLDILIPYFKAGLEKKEFCIWVVFKLNETEAKALLRRGIPHLDQHLAADDIEILPYTEWYVKDGKFNLERVIAGWKQKLDQVLAKGYAGMRISGDTAWLPEKDREDFLDYEKRLNDAIAHQRMIVLCTYPLTSCRGTDLYDVARSHEFAISRRHGSWEVLETPELKHAKAEFKRLNEDLERCIEERTRELAAANRDLKKEILERKEAERQSRVLIDAIPQQIWSGPPDGTLDYCNDRWRSYMGLDLEDLRGDGWQSMLHPDDRERVLRAWRESVATGKPYDQEERHRRADGTYRWFLARGVPLRDGERRIVRWYGTNTDIENQKEAEQMLRDSRERLRALTARQESLREDERIRVAREIHDELGQTLTGLKMDMLWMERKLGEQADSPAINSLLDRVVGSTELVDSIIEAVQQIATDLRPGVLDKLGLGPALQFEARRFHERTGIPCGVRLPEAEPILSTQQATALFRIFQEALTNVARHARARKVEVELRVGARSIILSVRDNGRGITEADMTNPESLGLLGMKERAELLGGEVVFQPDSDQQGTVVTVQIPQIGVPYDAGVNR